MSVLMVTLSADAPTLEDPLADTLRRMMLERGDVGLLRVAHESGLTTAMLSLLVRGKAMPGRVTLSALIAAYPWMEPAALESLRLAGRVREAMPA